MGMKRRLVTKVILWARPKNPPKWWHRDKRGRVSWVVVTESGAGFSIEPWPVDQIAAADVQAVQETFLEYQGRKFEFKIESEPA